MLNKYHFLSILFLLIVSQTALASQNCDVATELVNKAYNFVELDDKNGAKQLLKKALQLCPNHAFAHNNLAVLLEDEGNYPQAIAHYRQALQTKPNLSNAWYGLGETYYKQGQFPLSLEAHVQACKTDKDSRQRLKELFKNKKFAVIEQGNILNKESLLLLFDAARRQTIGNRLISDCGFRCSGIQPIITFYNFQFETGTATLIASSKNQLDELAAALMKLPNRTVKISGHIKESKKLCGRLSKKRAAAIARALVARGIQKKRLKTRGYGDTMPLSRNRAKNRRVEIEVKQKYLKKNGNRATIKDCPQML